MLKVQKDKKIKRVRLIAIGVMACTLAGGAFSYFTDYASQEISAAAGTMTIHMKDVTQDLTDGLTIMNPGDSNDLRFTVDNTGSKSSDVKVVITLTADQAMTTANHEYMITDNAGKELKGVLSSDGRTMVYTIDDVVLDGTVEKDAASPAMSHLYDYQFAMNKNASNSWQGKGASVTIEAFAKQHRNTASFDASDWTAIVEK